MLGEGGIGTVYKAEQRTPVKRTVALKLIKPGFDTAEVIARFQSERQALARMQHLDKKQAKAGGDDLTEFYHDWVVNQLIRREAEMLILGKSSIPRP